MAGKVVKRVGERVARGPADMREGARGPSRAETDQPIAAVGRGAECGIGVAECTERGRDVLGGGVRNVAADDERAAARITRERAMHAAAEIALALRDAAYAHGQTEAGAIGG